MSNLTKQRIFWAVTVVFCLAMAGSAYAYFTSPARAENFSHLGFPAYFRYELGVAKLFGVVALLRPGWRLVNEWAYAGFFLVLFSASLAHTAMGDPMPHPVMPLAFGLLLLASYRLRSSVKP